MLFPHEGIVGPIGRKDFSAEMTVNEEQLFDIIQNVWFTVVSLRLEPLLPGQSRNDIESEFLCAWMETEGDWNGGLLITCQESLAKEAAAVMYEVSDSMLGEDAIHDTIGELANMIAGSTKVLLPEDVSLLQPQVLEEADLPELCLSSWPLLNIATQYEGQLLYVSLFKWNS
ncbi:MAG: chemotaxis protein CheX [Myxococcota bacterium]|nr:chemotaxis protein CheX [Myxococcota bacterium]